MNVPFPLIYRPPNPVSKANPSKLNTLRKEPKSIKLYLVLKSLIQGIKPNRTQNPDELKKISKMVKDDSFKHP